MCKILTVVVMFFECVRVNSTFLGHDSLPLILILRMTQCFPKVFARNEWLSRDIYNRPISLSINCNTLILPWNNKLFNHSPARVVMIGRPMHRYISIVSSCLRYKIYTYVLCLKQSPFSASQLA